MATELNVDVLRGMGFDVPDEAGPNDLVVAIRGRRRRRAGCRAGGGRRRPRRAARHRRLERRRRRRRGRPAHPRVGRRPLAAPNLAVISVPGQHAVAEAFDAIASGLSVMLFSDNVPVEDEVRLKDAAAAADVLVMGPDCGTAVVGGVALGFANVVRPGSVGIVAASGTGAQQVMCLLDAAGVGLSHCLGVGGPRPARPPSRAAPPGRRSRRSPTTRPPRPSLVVSKPPDAAVLADIEAYAAELGMPVHWAVLGAGPPRPHRGRRGVPGRRGPPRADLAGHPRARRTTRPWPRGPSLRGLFCGGTLADEAMLVAEATLGGIRSNIPHAPELALGPTSPTPGTSSSTSATTGSPAAAPTR